MTHLTAEEIGQHTAMLTTPEDWPRWPVLPLKRRIPNDGWPELGIALAYERCYDPNGPITVWHILSLMVPTRTNERGVTVIDFDVLDTKPNTVYPNAAAIVADGWEVD